MLIEPIIQFFLFFGYFQKSFKQFLFHQSKQNFVAYCFGTEFVELSVREIKD